MKLPADKTKRIQVLVALGLAAVMGILALFNFVLTPIMDSAREARDKIATAQQRTLQSQSELERFTKTQAERDRMYAEINDISARYLLKPTFGTYILGVREIVERHAADAGVNVDNMLPIGVIDMPVRTKDVKQIFFRTFAVQVSGQASYEALVRMLSSLESGNPYICISGITVNGRPETPARHAVSFTIQWPIWADPNMEPRRRQEPEESSRDQGT